MQFKFGGRAGGEAALLRDRNASMQFGANPVTPRRQWRLAQIDTGRARSLISPPRLSCWKQ
jgi:hypothetical protein